MHFSVYIYLLMLKKHIFSHLKIILEFFQKSVKPEYKALE